MVILWYLRSLRISPKSWFIALVGLLSISFLSLSFSYGGIFNVDFAQMFARLLLTFDGVIPLGSGYQYPVVENGALYHFFQFFTFKLFGPVPGVGQILASMSPIAYPENGGPNDSLHAYFILGSFSDKFIVILFSFLISYVSGLFDAVLSSRRFEQKSFPLSMLMIVVCLNYPGFLSSTGTTLLLIARSSIVLLLLMMVAYILHPSIFGPSRQS
jgi:hypothetical protein